MAAKAKIESVLPCPWPVDIWQMTVADYVKAVPDHDLRTAIAGFLMRKGWQLLQEQIEAALKRSSVDMSLCVGCGQIVFAPDPFDVPLCDACAMGSEVT